MRLKTYLGVEDSIITLAFLWASNSTNAHKVLVLCCCNSMWMYCRYSKVLLCSCGHYCAVTVGTICCWVVLWENKASGHFWVFGWFCERPFKVTVRWHYRKWSSWRCCGWLLCMWCTCMCVCVECEKFSGYYGCDKCSQEGEYVEGKVTYPLTTAPLSTITK